MSSVKLRRPDGRYETIHGWAVLQTEQYRGWQIRVHWGGIEGRKVLPCRMPDVAPGPNMRKMIEIIDPAQGKAEQTEIKTLAYPFFFGQTDFHRKLNLRSVARVKKAIDAWEEKARKKFGVR